MTSKRDLLKRYRLYVILDRDLVSDKEILRIAREAARGGADLLQLRAKEIARPGIFELAGKIRRIAKNYGRFFIINDRPDIAVAVNADGLHIGQGDIDVSLAKRIIGKDRILGVSVRNFSQAIAAKREGADYLGAGPVFATPIKKHLDTSGISLLREIKKIGIPCFAIGGIDEKKAFVLAEEGFKNIAVIRAVCTAKNTYRATKRLKEILR